MIAYRCSDYFRALGVEADHWDLLQWREFVNEVAVSSLKLKGKKI